MSELLEKFNLTSDEKKQFNKTKHDLEAYREVILLANSVLKWEKKFFPAVLFGAISLVYAILWYLDFSVLTLIALGLLFTTLLDYFFPIASRFVFKSDNWTGTQEKKFEEVCHELFKVKSKLYSAYQHVFASKEDKSTMLTIATAGTLVVLAWIGATIDNLLLSYLATLGLAFYPGLSHNGMLNRVKSIIKSVTDTHLKNLMPKSKDE